MLGTLGVTCFNIQVGLFPSVKRSFAGTVFLGEAGGSGLQRARTEPGAFCQQPFKRGSSLAKLTLHWGFLDLGTQPQRVGQRVHNSLDSRAIANASFAA